MLFHFIFPEMLERVVSSGNLCRNDDETQATYLGVVGRVKGERKFVSRNLAVFVS